MSTKSAIHSHRVCRLGSVVVSIHGIYQDDKDGTSIALHFGTGDPCGLSAVFHASTREIRSFAALLIEHADITEKAQAEAVQS